MPKLIFGLLGIFLLLLLLPVVFYVLPALFWAYWEYRYVYRDLTAEDTSDEKTTTRSSSNTGQTINSTDYEVIDD